MYNAMRREVPEIDFLQQCNKGVRDNYLPATKPMKMLK
jgi:hypothetical protein